MEKNFAAVGKNCQRKNVKKINYDERMDSEVNAEVKHVIDASGQTHLNKSTKRRNERKNERKNEGKQNGKRMEKKTGDR